MLKKLLNNTLVKSFITFFTLFFIQRIIFYFVFMTKIEDNSSDILEAFILGLRFDLRWAAIPAFLLTLFSLVTLIKKLRPFYGLIQKITFITFMVGSFILYIFDYMHYSYLATRFNASALEFLNNKDISLSMAWASYPVIKILLLVILFTAFTFWLSKKIVSKPSSFSIKVFALQFIIFTFIVYGKFSFYPLRWSDAFFSSSTKLGNFTLNPISFFINTYKYKDFKVTEDLIEKHRPDVASYLGANESNLFLRRNTGSFSNKKFNVIIILLESIAYNKTSISDNPLDPTPELKKFAKQATTYNNFFTPTIATARSVFATITAIPDVTSRKMKSSSRNPNFVDQFVIWNQLKDYERYYFLGGSASWGNIRGVLKNNIQDLKLFEEGSYEHERIDVWGISDLNLFKTAFDNISVSKKRFFTMIQTSGFHRPYTIPKDKGDFTVSTISDKEVNKYGFHSTEEYNSIRLQDYSFGKFIKKFNQSKLKENTIIAVYGDHGLPSGESKHTPKGMLHHKLVSFHVPMLIYTPWDKNEKVDNRIVSELDIAPTLSYLSGNDSLNTTLGKNLYKDLNKKRYAFLYSWDTKPTQIFMIGEQFLYQNRDKQEYLFKYNDKDIFNQDVKAEYNDELKQLRSMGLGYYYYANFLLLNNKKSSHKK